MIRLQDWFTCTSGTVAAPAINAANDQCCKCITAFLTTPLSSKRRALCRRERVTLLSERPSSIQTGVNSEGSGSCCRSQKSVLLTATRPHVFRDKNKRELVNYFELFPAWRGDRGVRWWVQFCLLFATEQIHPRFVATTPPNYQWFIVLQWRLDKSLKTQLSCFPLGSLHSSSKRDNESQYVIVGSLRCPLCRVHPHCNYCTVALVNIGASPVSQRHSIVLFI